MELESNKDQETGTSSRAPGKDLSGITRGAWRGSDVSQHEIDWLYRSRRIPEGVSCRIPDEIEPVLNPGEFVVFLAHFERGFGLPASDFFRQFLDFYRLQPHHLPGNAVFYLSCFVAFMEGYIGIRPVRETFARFFSLPINSVQGKDIPKPKPPVQCGSCIIGSRQGSPFFKFNGLESCRLWQTTFFYVKNESATDLINLPPFNPAPPAKVNWNYNPGTDHIETNRVVRFMLKLMNDTNICSDDIIRTFISRRVLPLKRRAHKISEMYGPGDPTKITGLPLSKADVVLKANQICQTDMPDDWEWGLRPLSSTNPPTQEARYRFPRIDSDRRGPCRKRALDKFDPDPFINWQDLKMGRTPASRLGKSPPEPTDAPSAGPKPQVLEHVAPLGAEAGDEFVDKLMAQGQKKKAPAADAGPSQAPPAKRPRTEVLGGKEVGTKRYKHKRMPVSSGPALQLGSKPEGSAGSARTSTSPPRSSPASPGAGNTSASPPGGITSSGRAAPTPPDHRAEEDLISPPETQDIGASNTGADDETAGRAEPLVPPPKKKKKKQPSSSPTKAAPDTSAPASSASRPEAPFLEPAGTAPTPPPGQGLPAAKPKPPPTTPKITQFLKPGASRGKAVDGSASTGSQSLVLHVGPAAATVPEKPSGLLGRIIELRREGKELGHLLPYAQKWNDADISASTKGLGKDRLPAPDPAGPRSTEEHFMRLKRAVKEFDSAWYDATSNVVSTADARKQLFEELLWEHRDLAEAHSHCQAVPEATIETLKAQIATLQGEKEQLIKEHREALEAQRTASRELKEQAMQAALQQDQALKDAQAAAEARLAEVVDDSTNSNTVLMTELEEEKKARKAAEHHIEVMTTDHKEYDRLIMQIDALALQHFPDSQAHAVKKVMEDRVAREFPNMDAHWDGYDYLVALSARVQHKRSVDRTLVDLPDAAIQIFKVLWPGEAMPANVTLTANRLKEAGRRIREWQCSAARAGADTALRSACSWYPDLNLDALQGVREDAPTDVDPVLTAKRQDRAYRLAEYAEVRTFIPPPPDVKDYLSDEEEEEGDDDEDAEDAPPEAPEASAAPPEAPETGAAPPDAPVA
ncbi:hypothetical protein QYE76_024444 [Lolium multiflorum]|uniref:Transposase (putative) gypsy type domain-containing protein n=1 Tax=Lolium multiflorum TaxID=4521 RepID=A0AAD8REU5_LOLMU|nr:hypothetical protein QYE76_024444 [Lolium multiflorum]